jgi:D-Tyr-tRNAtyr deacylase
MRAVVQRVSQASVTVSGVVTGSITEPGLVVLVGVTHDDTSSTAQTLAAKIYHLRILEGERSAADLGGDGRVRRQHAGVAGQRRPGDADPGGMIAWTSA